MDEPRSAVTPEDERLANVTDRLQHTESIGRLDELRPGRLYGRQVAGAEVVLARVGDEVFACGGICSHNGAYLEMGKLVGYELHCPLHAGRFDIRTGEATHRPATYPIKQHAVQIVDGEVHLTVETDEEVSPA